MLAMLGLAYLEGFSESSLDMSIFQAFENRQQDNKPQQNVQRAAVRTPTPLTSVLLALTLRQQRLAASKRSLSCLRHLTSYLKNTMTD